MWGKEGSIFYFRQVVTCVLAVCAIVIITAAGKAEGENRFSIDLDISKRKVTHANNTLKIEEGAQVKINWTTDEAVALHLHGYDLHASAEPGKVVPMTFKAVHTGRFPVTAHTFNHGTLIYLEIHPQ